MQQNIYGDGSTLLSVPSGLGTALSDDTTSALNKMYYVDAVLGVGATITVDPPASSQVAFTNYPTIAVDDTYDLIVADGDDFIPDILGIGTTGLEEFLLVVEEEFVQIIIPVKQVMLLLSHLV